MMTKSELESTNLFKALEILESNGYKPDGFRYRKDVAYVELGIEDHVGGNETFALYVDILVNSYPPSLNRHFAPLRNIFNYFSLVSA